LRWCYFNFFILNQGLKKTGPYFALSSYEGQAVPYDLCAVALA